MAAATFINEVTGFTALLFRTATATALNLPCIPGLTIATSSHRGAFRICGLGPGPRGCFRGFFINVFLARFFAFVLIVGIIDWNIAEAECERI